MLADLPGYGFAKVSKTEGRRLAGTDLFLSARPRLAAPGAGR